MRTKRPIATVTWNSPLFLENVLNELIEQQQISFYCYIQHQPDEDSGKVHYHVFMIPTVTIDTIDFRDNFTELPSNLPSNATEEQKKPIRSLLIDVSKFDDWYLYALHDELYLESKGLKRNIHYSSIDVHSNDYDQLAYYTAHIDYSKISGNRVRKIQQAVSQNVSFSELCMHGAIPIQQIKQYEMLYGYAYEERQKELEKKEKERIAKMNEESKLSKFDANTGELIDN